MNNVSKKKIAAGYVVLLAVLLYSLFFVHREMENLMSSDNSDILRTDSLIGLLREKDANTVRLLRTLSEANDSMISAREVEQIIAEQDTIITQQRVQRRVTARRDTVVTQPKKKGFFRRLGEVFVPPRKDSAVQVQTTLEVATDTVLDAYNPVDSLHAKLRTVAQQKKATTSHVLFGLTFGSILCRPRSLPQINCIISLISVRNTRNNNRPRPPALNPGSSGSDRR